jgi:hypothetical protein
MKKTLISVLLIALVGLSVFADYPVVEVKGKVEMETQSGWVPVEKGAEIVPGTIISIGLASHLCVEDGGKLVYLSTMKRGPIEDFLTRKVTIGGNVITTDTSDKGRRTTNISTASARASDADADVDWEE